MFVSLLGFFDIPNIYIQHIEDLFSLRTIYGKIIDKNNQIKKIYNNDKFNSITLKTKKNCDLIENFIRNPEEMNFDNNFKYLNFDIKNEIKQIILNINEIDKNEYLSYLNHLDFYDKKLDKIQIANYLSKGINLTDKLILWSSFEIFLSLFLCYNLKQLASDQLIIKISFILPIVKCSWYLYPIALILNTSILFWYDDIVYKLKKNRI